MIVKLLGPNISSINAAVLTRTKIGGKIPTLIPVLVQTTTAETPTSTTVARVITMEEDITPGQVIITTRITESYQNHAATLHINRYYHKNSKNRASYCQLALLALDS